MNRPRALIAILLTAAVAAGLHGPDGRVGRSAATNPATTSAPATASAPTRPAMRRVHVFISGRVQGVGFRAFTRFNARSLGVGGWVRNLRDGRVEGVFEGPPGKVARLLAKVGTGPGGARVDKLKVTDEPYTGEFRTFAIRRTK